LCAKVIDGLLRKGFLKPFEEGFSMNVKALKKSTLLFFLFIFFIPINLYSLEIFSIQVGVFSMKNNALVWLSPLKNMGSNALLMKQERHTGSYAVNLARNWMLMP